MTHRSVHTARVPGTWMPLLLAGALAGAGSVACVGDITKPGGSGDPENGGTVPGDPGPGGTGGPIVGGSMPGAPEGPVPHVAMRRLTRVQYNNTIRDLLGITGDLAIDFGQDEDEGGFAANSKAPLKELQIEKYQQVAEDLATRAVGNLAKLAPCAPPAQAEAACLDQFLRGFGKRAYRRPLDDAELERYRQLFTAAKGTGDFASGLSLVISTMLQSPHFLYRPELGVTGASDAKGPALTQFELASRLAYFVQNTMPDDELLAAAETNKLRTPEEIGAQVRRLLAAPGGRDAMTSFFGQWLHIEDLLSVDKDPAAFAAFNPELRAAMKDEILEFADQVARQEGSLQTLLTAGYSYLKGPLPAFYGVGGGGAAGTGGTVMRKTDLPAGQRAGILTLAGVMARHAHPDQSSPVARGHLISERLLCIVPPPAPDNVDQDLPKPDPNLTTRARFEQHRKDPGCASCHALMDPLGLPFEIYDGMGRFRTMEGRQVVDATGELRGTDRDGTVKNAVELMGRMAEASQVRACVARQWFRYAFGREDQDADKPVLEAAVEAFAKSNHRLPDLVVALATTNAFRRRAPLGQ
jgi:hypothetical protein